MTAQPQENRYEVIIWDCDHAPDATEYFFAQYNYTEEEEKESILPCFCWKRRKFSNLSDAKGFVYQEVDGPSCAIGGAVFENGKVLFGRGMTFEYKEKYL